jgi:hypothetical protein
MAECCICYMWYNEHGHNAQPFKGGRCCNKCNDMFVIPERIRLMREAKEDPDVNSKPKSASSSP